jgi:hypothetical protein
VSDLFIHTAFGLRFRSRMEWLPLPRVEDLSSGFDVDVTIGSVPAGLGDEAFKTPRFEAQPGRLLFKTKTIADYLVEDGRTIRVDPKPDAEPLQLCNLLFGAVTGGLLIQRGTLALHGCSLETPAGAVIVCGGSGAGKSTLATLLLERGFRVLDDNIAALVERINENESVGGGGHFMVQPGVGYLRLTGDTLQMLTMKTEGPGYAAPFETKYLHFLGPREFCRDPRPLRHIFVLDRASDVLDVPLSGSDKLEVVRRYTFAGNQVPGLGQVVSHFQRWLQLAGSTPIHRLGGSSGDTVKLWADKIAGLILGRSTL